MFEQTRRPLVTGCERDRQKAARAELVYLARQIVSYLAGLFGRFVVALQSRSYGVAPRIGSKSPREIRYDLSGEVHQVTGAKRPGTLSRARPLRQRLRSLRERRG